MYDVFSENYYIFTLDPLTRIAEAYELFEQMRDGVFKVAITQ